jgi:hypothetical protein
VKFAIISIQNKVTAALGETNIPRNPFGWEIFSTVNADRYLPLQYSINISTSHTLSLIELTAQSK